VNIDHDFLVLLAKIASGFHLLGIVSAIQAIMTARTPQGAAAWAIGLITFPYISVPLYWIFGRDRFNGYQTARKLYDSRVAEMRRKTFGETKAVATFDSWDSQRQRVFEGLARMQFNPGNKASLCIDGQCTFESIFEAFSQAKEYILVQFFIVHNDEIGRLFKDNLILAARRGVRIYFLFDEVGSHSLPNKYIQEIEQAGIQIRPFKTTRGAKNRFQINFRNHRKIVIVDGKVGFVGGHNVGDEYLGRDKKFGHWRDTHVRIEGPAMTQIQVSFAEDWHWSSGEIPIEMKWILDPATTTGGNALILPSGPADGLDTCCLFFLEAINSAKKRIWLTSPYFVPDPQIISALQIASLRRGK
jgi:cardiolipin synthase